MVITYERSTRTEAEWNRVLDLAQTKPGESTLMGFSYVSGYAAEIQGEVVQATDLPVPGHLTNPVADRYGRAVRPQEMVFVPVLDEAGQPQITGGLVTEVHEDRTVTVVLAGPDAENRTTSRHATIEADRVVQA